MRRYLLAGLLLAVSHLAAPSWAPGAPAKAHCVWCTPVPCLSSAACGQCVCMRRGVDFGECVSIR
jgi:hypothetical protein